MPVRCATIRKCKEKDKEPGKPWCLYTKDGDELLGRHETKQDAEDQEAAIHAQSYLRLAVLELLR